MSAPSDEHDPHGLSTDQRAVVFGSGGHARAVMDLASRLELRVELFVDNWATTSSMAGIPVASGLPKDLELALGELTPILGVGKNIHRREIYKSYAEFLAPFPVLAHHSAQVSPRAQVGPGTVIFPGAVVGYGVRIGKGCIINSGSVVEHDSIIGDFVAVGPRAIVCGAVTIEEGAELGSGSCVLPRVVVGSWSTLGALSLARQDIPRRSVWIGVPASRLVRDA